MPLWGGTRASSPCFLLCFTIALLTQLWAACQFSPAILPWPWLHHHPRALCGCDEWAAACWWEANVSELPTAFTSAELNSKPNLQARAKQLNSKLPTAATANEPLSWHEPSRWPWLSPLLPAPGCQAQGQGEPRSGDRPALHTRGLCSLSQG